MKQVLKTIKSIYTSISNFINKVLVTPISKLIFKITSRFDKKGKLFENWLSKSNTLLFISLVIAISIFIIIDQRIVNYSSSSAEVLQAQNIEVLYDQDNYVVEGIPESVDITLIGNKADLYIAKQSPVGNVTIDLWGLKPGTHRVDIKYEQANGSIKYSVNPSVATVIIYDKVFETKTLSVDLLNQDSLDPKYIIDSVSSTTDSVVVQGANYKVEQVATVKALVDVKSLPKFELGSKITVSSTLRAYDELGNVVDVELSPSKVDVDLLISSPSREVPLKIIPSGNVVYNMGISSFSIENNPNQMITIYGPKAAIDAVEYIPVYIDVEGLTESTEFKKELEKPNDVKYMSADSVTVNVILSSDITNREIEDISILPINYNDSLYKVNSVDIEFITVKLKGVSDVVKSLTSNDINAYVDLSGLGVGTHEVDVIVTGDDLRVEYLSSIIRVKVRIYEK